MFHGKMKAVSFSFDDGTTQDRQLVRLFNRYGLKCTFNLNSALLGKAGLLICDNMTVAHVKSRPCEIKSIYDGHEVAVHALTHPNLAALSDEEIIHEVEDDRLALSDLVGYEIVGMAYPGGTKCMDDRVARVIREKTGVRYARTTTSTHSFDLQENLMVFNPTINGCGEWDILFELGEKFVSLRPDTPKLFYIWGHAFDFDIYGEWERFEVFCRLISGKQDIFYGTNREVLL
ncbi:MAG: polysaccharide deacetylase family protein [Firmicutes bacterium]|nr:polysaccharide deacetylase family protein [Bacillota bacterium]